MAIVPSSVPSGLGMRAPLRNRLLVWISVLPYPGRRTAAYRTAYPMAEARSAHLEDASATADFATFEDCFQRYTAEIIGYLWRMTCDEQAAQDLAQATFLRAWKHFDELRDYQQPRAWLFRVATNLALNHLRQRVR